MTHAQVVLDDPAAIARGTIPWSLGELAEALGAEPWEVGADQDQYRLPPIASTSATAPADVLAVPSARRADDFVLVDDPRVLHSAIVAHITDRYRMLPPAIMQSYVIRLGMIELFIAEHERELVEAGLLHVGGGVPRGRVGIATSLLRVLATAQYGARAGFDVHRLIAAASAPDRPAARQS